VPSLTLLLLLSSSFRLLLLQCSIARCRMVGLQCGQLKGASSLVPLLPLNSTRLLLPLLLHGQHVRVPKLQLSPVCRLEAATSLPPLLLLSSSFRLLRLLLLLHGEHCQVPHGGSSVWAVEGCVKLCQAGQGAALLLPCEGAANHDGRAASTTCQHITHPGGGCQRGEARERARQHILLVGYDRGGATPRQHTAECRGRPMVQLTTCQQCQPVQTRNLQCNCATDSCANQHYHQQKGGGSLTSAATCTPELPQAHFGQLMVG
jgi:hypothetical protein